LSNETTLYSDSLEIYDYLTARDDINDKNVVVMGRSIGTGVATYLAQNRRVSAVILSTPYDTLESVIQEKCPILPVSLIFSHKYDSIGRAPLIKQPLLVLVGGKDNIIPNWHSERLKEAWGGEVTYHKLPDEDHNTIDDVKDMNRIHVLSWKPAYKGIVPQNYLDELKEDFWAPAFEKRLSDEKNKWRCNEDDECICEIGGKQLTEVRYVYSL